MTNAMSDAEAMNLAMAIADIQADLAEAEDEGEVIRLQQVLAEAKALLESGDADDQ